MSTPAPLLYEINTRCWLRELSDGSGETITLANVPDAEFKRWQKLGFTHVWLMGVWTTGPRSRAEALADAGLRESYTRALPGWREEDVAGSPYAIADYRVPPALGGDAGLKEFRQRLQAQGLKLVLDFVPNHLGLDHPWTRERPELFVQSSASAPDMFPEQSTSGLRWLAHGKDPYFPGWTDTVQLDYRRLATHAAMTEVLKSVAERCDGVRCDMAMLMLNEIFAKTWERFPLLDDPSLLAGRQPPIPEFWAAAISAVKKTHPDFLFLAEVYWGLEARLHELGFDFTYDKTLYERLAWRDIAGVQRHLLGLPPEAVARRAHFLENHDEPRIASLLSPAEQRAAALVILGLPGMRFLHEGQLGGARCRVPVQLGRRAVEAKQTEVEDIYARLFDALPATAVGRGSALLLRPRAAWPDNPTYENFVIVQWQAKPTEFDLAVVNLAPHRSQCYAPASVAGLADHNWSMKDMLGQEQHLRSGQEMQAQGLYLDVEARGAQVFHFQPAVK